jgi:integrase
MAVKRYSDRLLDAYFPFRGKKRAKRPSKRSGTFRALTDGELDKLFMHAKPWLRRVLRFALLTGLRANELATLVWGDVRRDEGQYGVVCLRPENLKCGSGQAHANGDTVFLTKESRDVLMAGREALRAADPTEHVFTADRGGVLKGCGLLRALHRAARRAGIARRTPAGRLCIHSFRVSFCNRIALKVPLTTAHLLMRHANIAQTVAYFRKNALNNELAKGWRDLTTMLPATTDDARREA